MVVGILGLEKGCPPNHDWETVHIMMKFWNRLVGSVAGWLLTKHGVLPVLFALLAGLNVIPDLQRH